MKAVLEDIPSDKGLSSFYAYRFEVPYFPFKWHYHPEYELTYIIKGNGYRLVGNGYEKFSDGDLVLLGPNLPHTWSGNVSADQVSEAIVIQFSHEFIRPFLAFHESISIKKMLQSAERGLFFKAENQIVSNLTTLPDTSGMSSILKLVFILEELSKNTSRCISANTFHTVVSEKNEHRINKVCLFIQNYFRTGISVRQAAELIYLTESNFCKFFKKATGKTFSDYVNEIRISEAGRLLVQSEKTIQQISMECGFETLSYFNRIFLNKNKMTPSTYRQKNRI
jgi:AraC-like DNA-binding protein